MNSSTSSSIAESDSGVRSPPSVRPYEWVDSRWVGVGPKSAFRSSQVAFGVKPVSNERYGISAHEAGRAWANTS